MVRDAREYGPEHSEAIEFLRAFLTAIDHRDWLGLTDAFDHNASLFTDADARGVPVLTTWEKGAPQMKDWIEYSSGIRRFLAQLGSFELMVTDKSALVSVRSRHQRESPKRVMVLTRDNERWFIRHLYVERLGIDLSFGKDQSVDG